jgi:hypothetical protein
VKIVGLFREQRLFGSYFFEFLIGKERKLGAKFVNVCKSGRLFFVNKHKFKRVVDIKQVVCVDLIDDKIADFVFLFLVKIADLFHVTLVV